MKRDKKKKTSIDYFGKINFFQIPIPGGRIPQKIAKCFYPNLQSAWSLAATAFPGIYHGQQTSLSMEVMNTEKTFSEGV